MRELKLNGNILNVKGRKIKGRKGKAIHFSRLLLKEDYPNLILLDEAMNNLDLKT